jgi:hypothetical protein
MKRHVAATTPRGHPRAERFREGLLMSLSHAVAFVGALAVAAVMPTAAQVSMSSGGMSTTMPVSPSVLAMYIGERVDPGMERLRLLVLWRDEPGWFAREQGGGVRTSGGGAAGGEYRARWSSGGIELEAGLDQRTDTALVLGQQFDLRHSNVILIDGAAGQPVVVGTLGVQAQVIAPPGSLSLDGFAGLFALPDVRLFLRCDEPANRPVRIPANVCGPAVRR